MKHARLAAVISLCIAAQILYSTETDSIPRYPGARRMQKETTPGMPSQKELVGVETELYITGDSFDAVVEWFSSRGTVTDLTFSPEGERVSFGKRIKDKVIILDSSASVRCARHWVHITYPLIGSVTYKPRELTQKELEKLKSGTLNKIKNNDVEYHDIRDSTVIEYSTRYRFADDCIH